MSARLVAAFAGLTNLVSCDSRNLLLVPMHCSFSYSVEAFNDVRDV